MKMKNLYKISIICLSFVLFSCSTEDPISSKVTVYPIINVNSPQQTTLFVEQGETFTDPGAVATIDGVEVPLTTKYVGRYRGNEFEGTLDTNVSDVYTIEYSAENEDGFAGTVTRQVIVAKTGDLTTSIEGLYTSTVLRNGAGGDAYTDMEYILIWKNANGSYQISDALGGWYLLGRAIADSESPGGIIVANNIATNDFSFPGTQTNLYFGGPSTLLSAVVDAPAKTIDIKTRWVAPPSTTYNFDIHLEQVQF
jgi:hypothetical protein